MIGPSRDPPIAEGGGSSIKLLDNGKEISDQVESIDILGGVSVSVDSSGEAQIWSGALIEILHQSDGVVESETESLTLTDDLEAISSGEGEVTISLSEEVKSGLTQDIETRFSDTVESDSVEPLAIEELEPERVIEAVEASAYQGLGEPFPENVSLIIASLDNEGSYEKEDEIISGDGESLHITVEDDPKPSFRNDTEDTKTVGVLLENNTEESLNITSSVAARIISDILDESELQLATRRGKRYTPRQIEEISGANESEAQLAARRQ